MRAVPSHPAPHHVEVLRALISLVAPPLCAACQAHAGRLAPLCRECRAELARSVPTAHPPVASRGLTVWSPFAYDGPAGALVRALKFGGRVALADTMAAQIAAHAPPGLLAGGDLVPVPADPLRLRLRGFAQSRLIADALARRTGMRVADCLHRDRVSGAQSERGRAARIRALDGAIRLNARSPAPGQALLVDDVMTTGSTLAACASALRGAGCAVIGGITYCRTRGR